MIKWFFLLIILYYSGKVIMFFLPVFKLKKDIEDLDKKKQFRTKINKMDIVDAEFEENS